MMKEALGEIIKNHPELESICLSPHGFHRRFYGRDKNFRKIDFTEEFISLCEKYDKDGIIARMREVGIID